MRLSMNPTVQAALITAILSLIGTIANWIFSIANIRRDNRRHYVDFILRYKEACMDVIRLSMHVNQGLKKYLESDSATRQARYSALRDIAKHRDTSRNDLLKLRTEGIILFPFKKQIINKSYALVMQGFDKEAANMPYSPTITHIDQKWVDGLSETFPHYDDKIYPQLDKTINTYSTIKSFFIKE